MQLPKVANPVLQVVWHSWFSARGDSTDITSSSCFYPVEIGLFLRMAVILMGYADFSSKHTEIVGPGKLKFCELAGKSQSSDSNNVYHFHVSQTTSATVSVVVLINNGVKLSKKGETCLDWKKHTENSKRKRLVGFTLVGLYKIEGFKIEPSIL